eukprot:TRINITY_DN1635_c1_g2_i1.p2 TRINITY_DN1635_c1_g2~~TRINITY_DN1635_c1_g2_i1.p2  ORF type:complete len:339 (+),score=99.84 TRINITY_DN1635_c1_g2_i1:109-1125(+)
MAFRNYMFFGTMAGLFAWVWFTGFAALNLYISELIEYNSDLERASYDVHCWNFIGALAFVIVWGVIGMFAIMFILSYSEDEDDDDLFTGAASLSVALGFLFYVMICVLGFSQPFTQYRQLKLAQYGLTGPNATHIGCTRADQDPQHLTLPAGATYFILEDPQWHVDFNNRKAVSDYGWEYSAAKLVYTGPVDGCKFDPPLYATCIVKGASKTKCFYDESQTGAFTSMRAFWSTDYIDIPERKMMDKNGIPREQLVEYNSPSYEDIKEFIGRKKQQRREMWETASIVWVSCSLFLLIVFLVFCFVTGRTKYPSERGEAAGKEADEVEMDDSTTAPDQEA